MSAFREYIEHGWVLVPIAAGTKGPRTRGWNRRENCITDPDRHMLAAGLAHAYSGTMALDVDDVPAATEWLAQRGVDLAALFQADDAVQLASGRKDHAKLLFALPSPMQSKQIKQNDKCILDFRCATASGLTMQDVLPPSIHPDTGLPYHWVYGNDMIAHWSMLPQIPEALRKVWEDELVLEAAVSEAPAPRGTLEELRELLRHQDPSMSRDEWVRVGMAIHHETSGSIEGFELWDEWSQKSDKYAGRHDLETVWRSIHGSPNAVTIGSLRREAVATPDEFPDVHPAPPIDVWEEAAKERRGRFELIHASKIADRDPPEWIVEQLVPQADFAMMFGNSGAGKSFLALDLALSIATGHPWFNRPVKKGPIVWIAAEAAGSMRNRLRAYAQAHGVELETTDLWVVEHTLSLMSNEEAQVLIEVLQEKQPLMVVIDTLAAASGGANENSGEDMNQVLANCRKLHEVTGALVMLVHHSGKDASRGARGWSGIRAAMDAEFEVTYSEDSPIRAVTVTKQRDASDQLRLPFKLLTVPLDFDNTTSCVIEQLDETLTSAKDRAKLGGTQKLVFGIIYELAGNVGDESAAVDIQEVYDEATIQMPKPPKNKRDRRGEIIKRALSALHERGFVSINDDKVYVGSPYDADEATT